MVGVAEPLTLGDRPLGDNFNRSPDGSARPPIENGVSQSVPTTMGDVWRFLRPNRAGAAGAPGPGSGTGIGPGAVRGMDRATGPAVNRVTIDPTAVAVAAFWRRWSRLRPTVARALDTGELHAVEPQVATVVAGLHHRLGWSLSGGEPGEPYVLVVTGEGDQRLRPLTDAWLAAAPVDAGWEYHDAAQPLEDPSEVMLGIGDLQVALADVRVRALPDGGVLHVALHHPELARLAGEDRDALAFVALDTALGERLVERRIGCVEPVEVQPPGATDLMGLRRLVLALDTAATTATTATAERSTNATATVCPTG